MIFQSRGMHLIKILWLFIIFLNGHSVYSQSEMTNNEISDFYSHDYELTVNGIKSTVYKTDIPASFANIEVHNASKVQIHCSKKVNYVVIRPLSLGIKASVINGIIEFEINKPCKLSIEVNGDLFNPLFLFANKIDINKKDIQSKVTYHFKANKLYSIGKLSLKNNDVLYIEEGAIVNGSFYLENVSNVKIFGKGILNGNLYKKGESRMIEINRCKNILIEGITIINSKHWTVPCNLSENITYRNIKIISDNDWDDGIDIVSSKNVLVDDCFIRTKDDCIAIKAGVTYYTKFFNEIPTENVLVKNSVLWNAKWGNAIEIGFETRADSISNIRFENLDVIHTEGPEGCFTIHNGDRARVTNVVYRNINVEEVEGWLVDFRILKSDYTKDTSRGYINNIMFSNINVNSKHYPHSQILGYDEHHSINKVLFENFYINQQKINSIYNGLIATINTNSLQFK